MSYAGTVLSATGITINLQGSQDVNYAGTLWVGGGPD